VLTIKEQVMADLEMEREAVEPPSNPIGLDGFEYVEYTTSKPQALGEVLEKMGFRPVARHRSREVLLYRQGDMNIVVNASPGIVQGARPPVETPHISALALRVRNAREAHDYMLARGAWEVPMHAQAMELNIPGIHGPGGAHIYFIDRYREFSIYDIDFSPIPGVDAHPLAVAGLRFFGVVQYIEMYRTADWVYFYRELMGFTELPPDQRFGILPKGTLMQSPCQHFFLQLIEPVPKGGIGRAEELFQRIGLGAPDVPAAVRELKQRGVEFVELSTTRSEELGAITRSYLGSVMFELVRVPAAMSEGPK
jgi:4-hydroxyphenylpyruvate dioxygenase